MIEPIYLLLACWMIVSGMDDLWVDFCYLAGRTGKLRPRKFTAEAGLDPSTTAVPPDLDPASLDEDLIALWVPAWREHAVIARMIAHNVSSIRYARYHVFVGTYPNDEPTLDVLREIEHLYPNLHLSLTPHDGPTSKADNLNWIYQNLCLVEERLGERFKIIVIHDSEDLVHPEEFRWLNHYCRTYDFVQIPVLALPTPWWDLTHGVYCDEFAETQQKDLPTRNRMDGFSPSCGVGTGYRREALATLAESESNRIFEPDSLTEDYVNGMRMHRLGLKQIYLPVRWINGHPIATREYFPRNFHAAVRQRTRWVTGIALQAWQKFGWSRSWGENYWFWRDRKGLIGNPLSLISNALMLLGLGGLVPPLSGPLLSMVSIGLMMQTMRMASRMYFTGRVYGVAYAAFVPLRIPWSNLINTLATLSALRRFARAQWNGEPLVWLKTEHAYPNRQALNPYTRRIGEVLADLRFITQAQLEAAVESQPADRRLGEYLVDRSLITWEQLYQGLSTLSAYPSAKIPVEDLEIEVARSLPRSVISGSKVQPVRYGAGSIIVAACDIPTDSLAETIHRFTSRDPMFVLVTPANFSELREYAESAAALSMTMGA